MRAAEGELPGWSRVRESRRPHLEGVAALLGEWAGALELTPPESVRWRAVGWLHDCLRDEDPEELRRRLSADLTSSEILDSTLLRGLPDAVLHGPAAAARLETEGIGDREFVLAIAFHTLGHPSFGSLGRALYAADFLDPGRSFLDDWRRELRARMPHGLDGVVREIVARRIERVRRAGLVLRFETVAFQEVLEEEFPS